MSQNCFQLNQDKPEILVTVKAQREKQATELNPAGLTQSQQVWDLDVVSDSELNFKAHVGCVTKSAFYPLKHID